MYDTSYDVSFLIKSMERLFTSTLNCRSIFFKQILQKLFKRPRITLKSKEEHTFMRLSIHTFLINA